MNDTAFYSHLSSPLGDLLVISDGERLTSLHFPTHQRKSIPASWQQFEKCFREVRRQLEQYFAGKLQSFDLPLSMAGTDFERKVWDALTGIGYGQTVSYSQVARQIGQSTACRAVGMANGRNPIPIIVPCHRVIGANGSLTGYGGGLETKRWLLALEGVDLPLPKARRPAQRALFA